MIKTATTGHGWWMGLFSRAELPSGAAAAPASVTRVAPIMLESGDLAALFARPLRRKALLSAPPTPIPSPQGGGVAPSPRVGEGWGGGALARTGGQP